MVEVTQAGAERKKETGVKFDLKTLNLKHQGWSLLTIGGRLTKGDSF